MTKLEALTQKVTDLSSSVAALGTAVDGAVSDIKSLNPTDAQLDTLATSVQSLKDTIDAQAQRLNEAVNPPAPAPAPEPTPAQ